MSNPNFTFRPHDRATYEHLQDDRVPGAALQDNAIYSAMLRVDQGRLETASATVRLEKVMKEQGVTWLTLVFLFDDFTDARPVPSTVAFQDHVIFNPGSEIVFTDPSDGMMRMGYILPQYLRPTDGPLTARQELDLDLTRILEELVTNDDYA